MREVIVLRPKVTPLPADREALEAKLAAVVPPPNAVLLRDRWQKRVSDETPALLRRQAG